MSEWKKVKIDFATIKLGDYIEPIKTTVADTGDKNPIVYGVSNKDGISQTGKPASKDISNYIVLEKDCFAFNPYRINVGSIGVNDENLKGCVSPAYVVFKTKNGLLPKFLYFYLKSDYGIHLINWYGNRGGVRNALRYSDLCKIDIPDIRHLNQEKLLKTFSSAWTQIEELNKEIEKQKNYAKQLRQSILQEAIEGKLTADWRKQHPVQKGNPDYDAEALFEKIQAENSETKSSKKTVAPITKDEIPFEIPTGWKWVRLGEICEKITDGTHKTPKYTNSGVKFVSAKDIYNKELDFSHCKYISENEHRELYKRCNPEYNDLLISKSGSIGTVALNNVKYEFSLFESLALVKYNQKLMLPKFMQYAVQYICNNLTASDIKGVCVKHLHLNVLSSQILSVPPLAEQKEIVARVEKHLQTITQLETQIATRETTTKQLMQSILKDAFEEKSL